MFTNDIKFKYPWRSYQDRVLQEIEKHLNDNRLHVVAPPGSGKTVLGLEIVRRLNRPTLILSPTITIQNQWLDRFDELFTDSSFAHVSMDLRHPSFLTSSTYQSLHAAYTRQILSNNESDDISLVYEKKEVFKQDVIKLLTTANVEVIVLDEAHHLKLEWWKSLTNTIKQLEFPTIVALTATPPYDSPPIEWERYNELCGPIDAEISIPELVKENNLCPHQDLIYISTPTKDEYQHIDAFYENIQTFKNYLDSNTQLVDLLTKHPVVLEPEKYMDDLYNNIEYYSSIVIYLHYKEIPCYSILVEYLGQKIKNIPIYNDGWLEILLTYALHKDPFLMEHDTIVQMKNDLKRFGLIEKRKVILRRKASIDKLLSSSLSKFRGIRTIVDVEYNHLQSDLRLVILSDFVRKEFLHQKSEINKFGIIPIFRFLVETNRDSTFNYFDKIAVLSGTICIVPNNQIDHFKEYAEKYYIDLDKIKFKPIRLLPQFSEINVSVKYKSHVVKIITELFSNGHLNIIIGTKSLLGEGWDCQAINSLVLATFIGSYMLSNQMRGRAIRTQVSYPNKTSNIWHLLCVDRLYRVNNCDFDLLKRRFKCFIGPHIHEDILTNGIERLNISKENFYLQNIETKNNELILLAIKRKELHDKWITSINRYKNPTYMREIKIKKKTFKRSFIFLNTIKFILVQGISFAIGISSNFFRAFSRGIRHIDNDADYIRYGFGGFLLLIILFSLYPTIRSIRLAIKHGPITSSFKQICNVIFNTMKNLNMVENSKESYPFVKLEKNGVVFCCLKKATPYEQSLFLKSLEELLGPIENPRYLITRKGKFLVKTLDYHNVPKIFTENKDKAELFHSYWEKHMGPADLIYTRTLNGRRELIKARTNSLASAFQENTDIIDSWRE